MNRYGLKLKLLVAVLCFIGSTAIGQVIDTIEIEGKSYFVYPFKVNVNVESEYFSSMKQIRGRMYRRFSYRSYVESYDDLFGPKMTKQEYASFNKEMRKYAHERNHDSRKYIDKKFKKAVRLNPYPLLQQRFERNKDVIPVLDPIPDGDYIQFYEIFCLIDSKGECKEETQLVAGYFSIENNTLHGDAVWLDLKGDTLKQGNFQNGLKEGVWKFEKRKIDYTLGAEDAELYVNRGYPEIDTTIEYITFVHGASNGAFSEYRNSKYPVIQGYYINGEPSGEWISRDITYKVVGYKKVKNRNNELITERRTYATNDSLVVKSKWMRHGLVETYGVDRDQFNFFSKYSIGSPPALLYEINFERELELELDEELDDKYDLDDYELEYGMMDEMYYDGMGDSYGESEHQARSYDPIREEYKNRGVLLDSLGGKPRYTGTYERYYRNGNRMYSYQFVDGILVKEDTIFWDNGHAHDVITTRPDSNQYLRSIYDYDGKIYEELIYDSLGDFVRVHKNHMKQEVIVLDGLEAIRSGYGGAYLYYNNYDTLKADLAGPVVVYRSWKTRDSSMLFTLEYDPTSRLLKSHGVALTGKKMNQTEQTFSEDFESWTGKRTSNLGDLEIIKTSSGSLSAWMIPDSVPQTNVGYAEEHFDVASDYRLKRAGTDYTGPVELQFGARNLTISKKNLTMTLPRMDHLGKKLKSDIIRYEEKGKTNYPLILDFINPIGGEEDISGSIFSTFFLGALDGMFWTPRNDFEYEYGYSDEKGKNKIGELSKIVGFMLDGKPQGLWVSYNQYGEKMFEVSYNKGEPHGESITYRDEFPRESGNEFYGYNSFLSDSTPTKKVHYISNTKTYLNGSMDGLDSDYNWMGEVTRQATYVDGYLDGPSIERNKLAISKVSYKNGVPDGYYQTYLTLPNRDSILLYDLNFQDGLLQGESKAYHTNGKLAKRGFFLNGEPIEDYEGYDSLGFRYHYVKFKYAYPIEEKIWEENELSVQYKFDWKDSIHFESSDITTSQSLEAVLYNMGLGSGMDRPYYGRPSLVNKRGIRYHMTKYFPNDQISREGDLDHSRKVDCWKYYNYDGELLYEVDYQDSIIELNDSIKFKSKGILSDFDAEGNLLHRSFVTEKFSKYDCAHTDHYEIRQYYTIWEADDSLRRMNGFTRNFYDNGTLQSEGTMENGLPVGIWKYFDPFGKLNLYGHYVQGKRDGRWLSGDLSKTKYLGDICLNPNMIDLADEIKYRENLLDITITNYQLGKSLNREYYDINMNRFIEDEETTEDGDDLDLEELESPEE